MALVAQEGRPWPPPLGHRITEDADVEQIADTVVAIWLEIDQTLYPIIGHRGVAALYNRSLKLTAAAYPWLAMGHPGLMAAPDPAALKGALMQHTAADAAAGGSALFQTFHELLASLVGVPLTERLLSCVWASLSGASAAQDTSS
jgi:hypothetical protein